MEEITWDYFHPFFWIILNEKKIAKIEKIYWNKDNLSLYSTFSVDNDKINSDELNIIIYNYIDEMSGLLVSQIDPALYFTTKLTIDIITNKPNNKNIIIDGKFNVVENHSTKKKIIYNLYTNNSLMYQGHLSFKKPKKDLPMAKF